MSKIRSLQLNSNFAGTENRLTLISDTPVTVEDVSSLSLNLEGASIESSSTFSGQHHVSFLFDNVTFSEPKGSKNTKELNKLHKELDKLQEAHDTLASELDDTIRKHTIDLAVEKAKLDDAEKNNQFLLEANQELLNRLGAVPNTQEQPEENKEEVKEEVKEATKEATKEENKETPVSEPNSDNSNKSSKK